MGHGKETPRQKMIGMMYLVLTALLALNVSKDILEAFVVVNEGLQVANRGLTEKNNIIYSQLNQKQASDARAKPVYEAALDVKKKADQLFDTIQYLKGFLIQKVEGIEDLGYAKRMSLDSVSAKDNYDIPTNMLLGDGSIEQLSGSKANELKKMLIQYKDDLIAILKRDEIVFPNKTQIIESLEARNLDIDLQEEKEGSDKPEDKHWEHRKFYHSPLAAVITILSQIQTQVRNAEGTVVEKLFSSIGATDFTFDKLEAKVVPQSQMVSQGDKYRAELFVGGINTSNDPTIVIGSGLDSSGEMVTVTGDTTHVPVSRGVGTLEIPASSLGEKNLAGAIFVTNANTGEVKSYPFDLTYVVQSPTVVVSPTKMNVLYVGVDNPLSISVSGYADDQITAGISQGSLRRAGEAGAWVARVTRPGRASVNVSVSGSDGKSKSMPSIEFRVKTVPDPVAKLGGQTGGYMNKNVMLHHTGLGAILENFEFDMRFIVTGFKMSVNVDNFMYTKSSNSYQITPEMKALLQKARPPSKVYFEEIKARGPDGTTRNLSPLIFTLQ